MLDEKDQIPVRTEFTSENKCGLCPGTKCCNYITQAIDPPRSISDFDTLLWQLAHQNVQAYKDDDGWFLIFYTRCQFLQDDGRCGTYDSRPQMCRDYSNDFCEFDSPAEEGFELFFDSYDTLLKYCRNRFKTWDSRFS